LHFLLVITAFKRFGHPVFDADIIFNGNKIGPAYIGSINAVSGPVHGRVPVEMVFQAVAGNIVICRIIEYIVIAL
jgi:hypothetical protein